MRRQAEGSCKRAVQHAARTLTKSSEWNAPRRQPNTPATRQPTCGVHDAAGGVAALTSEVQVASRAARELQGMVKGRGGESRSAVPLAGM